MTTKQLVAVSNDTKKIPLSRVEQFEMWQEIYSTYFNLKIVHIHVPILKNYHQWLIVVHNSMTMSTVLQVMRTKMTVNIFDADNFGENLDFYVSINDRVSNNGDYIIFVKDGVESDADLQNISSEQVIQKRIKTMTLLERLLLELFYFHFTGDHLDVKHGTLCVGSRIKYDNYAECIPCVYWYSREGVNICATPMNYLFDHRGMGARSIMQ